MKRVIGVAAALTLSSVGPAAGATSPSSSPDVRALRPIQQIPMTLAKEIEFDGRRAYVAQFSTGPDIGVRAFDLLKDGRLKPLGMLACSGITDIAPLDRGLVAIGLEGNGNRCTASGEAGAGGVHVGDMHDPARPTLLGALPIPGGVHLLTRYPGTSFVYTAMGGSEFSVLDGGLTHVVDVSDPRAPKIAAVYQSPLNPAGCHDILFERIEGKTIGFCPGLGGTEIWDASDPLAPVAIGRMQLSAAQLPHQVAVSADGKVVAVSDEAVWVHGCTGGGPLGAIWFYDITDLTSPVLMGFFGPQRGRLPAGTLTGFDYSCTAHNLTFIGRSRLLVAAWNGGGTNVIDISSPKNPKEVAHYWPDDAVAQTSYWYRGRIYVTDFVRGVEVLQPRRSI